MFLVVHNMGLRSSTTIDWGAIVRVAPFLFALVTGASALVYEVAWVRVLSVDFGNTIYAVSLVTGVFMLGLAAGGRLLGKLVDRRQRPLRLYCVVELLLGGYALGFALCVQHVHRLSAYLLSMLSLTPVASRLTMLTLSALLLLPPTFLMGGTLPILVRWARPADSIGARAGLLYGINTAGALIGCLATAYWLIVTVGVRGSILLAASANILVAAAAALIGWLGADGDQRGMVDGRPVREAQPTPITDRSWTEIRWGVLAFGAGFISLAAQIVWTRLFINMLSGNVLIFASVLAGFLAGISFGGFLGSRVAVSGQRLHKLISGILLASAIWLTASAEGQVVIAEVFGWVHQMSWTQATSAYWCMSIVMLAVAFPATLLGVNLPLFFHANCSREATVGQDIGTLLMWNTMGAVAGSLVAGLVLLDAWGINTTLVAIGALCALMGVLVPGAWASRFLSVGVSLVILLVLFLPDSRESPLWFNGGFTVVTQVPRKEVVFHDEGVEATVAVLQKDSILELTVNGIVVAETTKRDLWDLLLKAHLPMLLHPSPERIAVIGLGAGISLGAIEAYEEVQHIDCIEISREVIAAHQYFKLFNARCWQDARLRMVVDDGRHFLLASTESYDVINVDPVDPPVCTQYTRDFFQLCQARLNSGGLMVQWVPLFRLSPMHLRMITGAFLNVFPSSTLWYDGTSMLLIGRRGGPLEIDTEHVQRRAQRPAVRQNLSLIGHPDASVLLATFVCGAEEITELVGSNVPENTDDLPYLEYSLLLDDRPARGILAENLQLLHQHWQTTDMPFAVGDTGSEFDARVRLTRGLLRRLLLARAHSLAGHRQQSTLVLNEAAREFDLGDVDLEFFSPFLPRTPEE